MPFVQAAAWRIKHVKNLHKIVEKEHKHTIGCFVGTVVASAILWMLKIFLRAQQAKLLLFSFRFGDRNLMQPLLVEVLFSDRFFQFQSERLAERRNACLC